MGNTPFLRKIEEKMPDLNEKRAVSYIGLCPLNGGFLCLFCMFED